MRIHRSAWAAGAFALGIAIAGSGCDKVNHASGPDSVGNKEAVTPPKDTRPHYDRPDGGSTAATSGSQDTNGGVKAGPNKEVPDTNQKTGQGREPDQTHPK